MLLVVDAEVIFACLIKRGFSLELVKVAKDSGYRLVTPEYVFEEIRRKEDKLLKYSKLERSKLWFVLFLLFSEIEPVVREEYKEFEEEARKNAPLEDFPYLALALKFRELGEDVRIWSNDSEFRKKSEKLVPFVSTKELALKLGVI
ncbi:hypothetical protein J7L36_00635 [bacterium]|nr:hypothetical protein [bacterium]